MVLAARSLGCERRCYALWVSHLQGAIHLVGRDMVESLALVTLRKALPIGLGCLEQRQGSHHIGLCEGERVLDASIHVAFGGKMDDAIHVLVLHQLIEGIEVADVHLHEFIVWLVLDVLQVGEVASVGQLIEVDDVVLRILVHEEANNV